MYLDPQTKMSGKQMLLPHERNLGSEIFAVPRGKPSTRLHGVDSANSRLLRSRSLCETDRQSSKLCPPPNKMPDKRPTTPTTITRTRPDGESDGPKELRYGLEGLTGLSPRHNAQQVTPTITPVPIPMAQGVFSHGGLPYGVAGLAASPHRSS